MLISACLASSHRWEESHFVAFRKRVITIDDGLIDGYEDLITLSKNRRKMRVGAQQMIDQTLHGLHSWR